MMKPTTKSIHRVSRFLKKTIVSIKSTICFRNYHNLPNDTPLLNSSTTSSRCPWNSQTEETYSVISCESAVSETKHENVNKQQRKTQKKVAEPLDEGKRRGVLLAQKMKELNMVDMRDVEHASDVREALRCYSSIRSPVYLDIVDNFFTDMYYEFSDPRTTASASIRNGPRRKAGSFRL